MGGLPSAAMALLRLSERSGENNAWRPNGGMLHLESCIERIQTLPYR